MSESFRHHDIRSAAWTSAARIGCQVRASRNPDRLSSRSLGMRTVIAGICATLLSSCADFDLHIPEHQRPDTPGKASWSRQSAVSAADTITPDWWKAFQDPYLDLLIDKAIEGNFDLKVLAARIGVASAQIGEARAGALPMLDIGAGTSIEKTTGQKSTRLYSLGTQVIWDIDIWGQVEKGVQAQTAEYHATEADWRAGFLRLVADVSTTYFQIRQFDEQIDRQQQALGKNKQIRAIYEAMHDNGLISSTQVLRQRAEINRLTKDLLELKRSRDLAENALATLTGVPARELNVPPGRLQESVQLRGVPAGLPSALLARRPDIIAAEHRVLAAYNLVGQAKLLQLPSISLTGRAGSASFALSDLLKSFTFGLAPSLNIPALNPGIRARIRTTEAQTRIAEQDYRRTVIAAFEEVENALVSIDARRKQRTQAQRQVDHLKVVATQVEAQLKEGLISQLEVFETERSLLAAQLALLAHHQQILSDTVTLYKALGGGWPTITVANASD